MISKKKMKILLLMVYLRAGCTEYFIIIYWGEVIAASPKALRSEIAKYLLLFDGITSIIS